MEHFHLVTLLTSHNASTTQRWHTPAATEAELAFPADHREAPAGNYTYSLQQPQSWDHFLPLARGGGTNRLSQRTTHSTAAESLTECPAREDHPNHLGVKTRCRWSPWTPDQMYIFDKNTFVSNWNITISSKLKKTTLLGLARPFSLINHLYVYINAWNTRVQRKYNFQRVTTAISRQLALSMLIFSLL